MFAELRDYSPGALQVSLPRRLDAPFGVSVTNLQRVLRRRVVAARADLASAGIRLGSDLDDAAWRELTRALSSGSLLAVTRAHRAPTGAVGRAVI
jgi:hypothetical protein